MPSTLGIVASAKKNAPPYNPLSIPWHAAYWASDPAWTPPVDGATVAAWRDGSGNGRTMAPSAGGPPTYRSASSVLSGKPGIQFAGSTDLASPTFPGLPFPPLSLVAVISLTTPAAGGWFQGGSEAGNSVAGGAFSSQWQAYAGAASTPLGGVADTGKHLVYWQFDATGVKGYVDGALVTSGATGAISPGQWALGRWPASGAAWCASTIGFAGFKTATLTAQETSDMLAWSRSFYGTP
jgi:hypothetical protein